MQSHKIKKGGNSNSMQSWKIKKGRQLQFNRLQCNRAKYKKKGGNSNLIDCNAIAQNKKRETTPI